MRGGPVPGSARLTGSEVGLVPVVNEVNVSLNRGSNCRSLCSGIDISELVKAFQIGSSSGKTLGCVELGVSMVMSFISVCIRSTFVLLALLIHSLVACQTSSCIFHCVVWVLL